VILYVKTSLTIQNGKKFMIPNSIQLFTNQSVKHKNGEVYKVKKDYGGVVTVFIPPRKLYPNVWVNVQILSKQNLEVICESIHQ
jgi:hypothetical protein